MISTRRPITPREPRRQLYGKVSLADRPPSAFRYKMSIHFSIHKIAYNKFRSYKFCLHNNNKQNQSKLMFILVTMVSNNMTIFPIKFQFELLAIGKSYFTTD